MDDLKFYWGESIDDALKPLLLRGLTDVCRFVPSYTSSNGRTRTDVYKFIASLDENIQKSVFDKFQRILADPTSRTCKANWLLKRKVEAEELEIRNVKAKLEHINNNLRNHGENICSHFKRLLLKELKEGTLFGQMINWWRNCCTVNSCRVLCHLA